MTLIAWYCKDCNWIIISNSKEHHIMNHCKCGECAIDLEEYGCRYMGNPIIIARQDKNGKWRRART